MYRYSPATHTVHETLREPELPENIEVVLTPDEIFQQRVWKKSVAP
jgi:hypothetical protein